MGARQTQTARNEGANGATKGPLVCVSAGQGLVHLG